MVGGILVDIVPYISFFTGVASILSPCVLPVIPIIFAASLFEKRKSEIISFIFGLFSIFLIIIGLTMAFTVAINSYLIYVRLIASIVLIILGLAILFKTNLFESVKIANFSSKLNLKKNQTKNNVLSSFILGVITSLAWAPCYSAYLFSLVSLVLSKGDAFYGALNLLIYVVGFGLAIFLIAFFISSINLEKLIDNSNLINKVAGILILISGIYMLYLQIFGFNFQFF